MKPGKENDTVIEIVYKLDKIASRTTAGKLHTSSRDIGKMQKEDDEPSISLSFCFPGLG
jgi:hypothetical protein